MPISPITNYRPSNQPRARLPVERQLIWQPETEWTYSHHASLTSFNGRLYAIWSSGRQHEDDVGQRVMLAVSDDFATWRTCVLFDSLLGQHAEGVLTAAGFHTWDDTLVAYAGFYEYDLPMLDNGTRKHQQAAHHLNTRLLARTSSDGETWSDIHDVGLPIVPNHPPQTLHSGRLLLSGNVMYPYTDNKDGLSDWQQTGISAPDTAHVYDDPAGFWIQNRAAGQHEGLCEGSFFQTDDGVVHMLLRSREWRLYVTESADDGQTWSKPVPTQFSDNNTKFHFGRLPDGRYYYVGNPDPEPRGQRIPLVLILSDDGIHFEQHYILADDPYTRRRAGLHKHGHFGYPHTAVIDNHLYVIVSRLKEAIEVLRLPLHQFDGV